MQFEGIIFDLDGTLANTLDDIAGSMNRVLIKHGYSIHPVYDYKLLVGRGLDNLVKQALPSDVRSPEIVALCLSEMMQDYEINCIVKTHLYEGIMEMTAALIRKKLPMSVFSNKTEPLTVKIIQQLLGGVPFVKVMGARPDVPKKPDPAGALMICKQMKLASEKVIYMGDSDVDMITASRAGMYGVGVSWGFRSAEELRNNGAHKIINHPLDILQIIL
jgi:phosphoglycolate phosphatase